MKRAVACLVALLSLFLFMIPFSLAQDWMYDSSDLTMYVDINSEFELVPLRADYAVDYVHVNLSLFPRNAFGQSVLSLSTNPDSVKGESVIFTLENPTESRISYSLSSKVRVKNDVVKIKSKVGFPLNNIPKEYMAYTKPAEKIDSGNEDIVRLANQIASGEDDLYVVVFKLAAWVEENIEYNLTTLTATVSQPASWVLKNRYGVCDELTSLFIAMARSLGIPARYVSGVAYTNFQGLNDWGNHAWAEVYFPGYGWVPFDVTYREFGFVDPTHIALQYSIDSGEPSVNYRWLGRNVELKTDELAIKTQLVEKGKKLALPISISADVLKENVGFGSYNLVEVTVENLEDYYTAASLSMANVYDLEIVGEQFKHLLLKPGERLKEYWIIQLSGDFRRNYKYTIPIKVYSERNIGAETEFYSTSRDEVYSFDDINGLLKEMAGEEKRSYSKQMDLLCVSDKSSYYIGESPKLDCVVKNTGNVFLENLGVCAGSSCQTIDLGITQEKKLSFLLSLKELGKQEIVITAENPQISKTTQVTINVLDKPKVEIADLQYPAEVSYKDAFSVKFTLLKKSASTPKNVRLALYKRGLPKKWEIDILSDTLPIEEVIKGSELGIGENRFRIFAEYEDERGNVFSSEESFSIGLANVTFSQRIAIFFKGIGGWFLGLAG